MGTLGTLLIILLPLALAVPAVQMFIAIFCRSYKEGQTYLSLLMFVPMVPGFLFAFDAVGQRSWMSWTPLLSQQLAVATLIKGDPSQAARARRRLDDGRLGLALHLRAYAW